MTFDATLLGMEFGVTESFSFQSCDPSWIGQEKRGLDLSWTSKAGEDVEMSGSFPREWSGQEVSKE